jgi:HEAT repeat protein/CheY-like chemotaxis protein
MLLSPWRAVLVVLTALLAVGPVPAQEIILPYNRTPETVEDCWAAVKYEINLGNHQRAAAMLKRFYERLLARNPEEQDRFLLRVYDSEGMSTYLKLANIETIRQQATAPDVTGKQVPVADILLSRVTKLVEGRLGDMARIQFFVKNLSGTAEERAYAITQLRASGYRAVPAMVAVLADPNLEKSHPYVTYALQRMDRDVTPPLVAALDANNPGLRSMILNVLFRRADERAVPALWWIHGAKEMPETLRAQAASQLAQFLHLKDLKSLGDPREALTRYASQYYYQPARAPEAQNMVWRWDGKELVSQNVTPAQYREHYGLHWARKALEIDPGFRPAQIMFLSIALEHAYSRLKPGEALEKTDPQLAQVLAASGNQLLEQVLDQALKDNRPLVVLGATKALARTGDVRLLRGTEKGASPLSVALRHPDQRVRLAAAEAIINIPQAGSFPGASRVVEVFKRVLAGEGKAKVLIGYSTSVEGQNVAGLIAPLGHAHQVVTTGRELLRIANEDGDVSLIILDPKLADPMLPYILSELKTNPNTSGIPIVLLADEDQAKRIRGPVARHGSVLVLTPPPATADKLKAELEAFVKSPPLTPDERKANAKLALDLLLRIARGEVPGYELRLADDAMARAMQDDDLAPQAASVLALRPGRKNQQALAEVALSGMRPLPVRVAALDAVRMSIQRYGILVGPKEIAAFVQLPPTAMEPELQTAAARLAAMLQPNTTGEGQRLRTFTPAAGGKPDAPAPAPGKPGDKEKEKEKDGEK